MDNSTSPFYGLVPKDPVKNLRWRIRCRERAMVDKRFRDVLYQACMSDVCFWMAFACIGEGTRVVTDRGPVPIQHVTANDLVWDGAEWVSQGGAVYKGRRASIFAYKIHVTPDHEIWTQHGWKPASERHDREGVRIPDGYSEKWQLPQYDEGSVVVPMQVRQGNDRSWRQSSRRQEHELRMQVERSQVHSREDRQSSVQYLERHASAMYEQAEQSLEALRRSWNQGLRTVDEVRELLRGHGRPTRRAFAGSHRQRWQLRTGKLSLGHMVAANAESTSAHNAEARHVGRSNDDLRDYGSHWFDACRSVVSDKDGFSTGPDASTGTQNTKVYDLLNCGPRQCFTVLDADGRPLLVHNCWGYDPRARVKIVPFIPYPHQASVFVAMDEAINTSEREEKSVDVVLDKARAQGGTFGYLWVDLRRWLRDPMFSAGYVTRNEDLIDSKSDSSTVLWKVAWAIERLPFWMKPSYERHLGHHTFINHENGALLRGYSAGQDVAAGGRATVFTVDEAGARDFVAGGKDEAVQESIQDVSNCAARGTLVVTNEGLIPIEDVQLHHRVWDGTMWVSHDGCIYQGEQETIQSYGIELTPDHRVLTKNGWANASCGFERSEVRLPDGYRERYIDQDEEGILGVSVSMRNSGIIQAGHTETRLSHNKLRMSEAGMCQDKGGDTRPAAHTHVECLEVHATKVRKSEQYQLSELWQSRNTGVRSLDEVREFPGGHGREAGRLDNRPHRQRQELLPRELQVGVQEGASAESTKPHQQTRAGGSCFESIPNLTSVYDLLNCGPRRAFTVIDDSGRPLLIHNCVRLVSARYTDQGVFHNACENPDTAKNGVHLVLDWKDHPKQSKHSYIVREGVPIAMKPEDQPAVNAYHKAHPDLRSRLERKGFKFDNVIRSPWYDSRCLRPTATPRLIASQLDRNPRGAVGKVFSSDLLDRMKREHCKKPVWVGNPVFDAETCELIGLVPREDGLLKLWFRPGIDNSPPLGPFTVGCDIASGGTGAYASNSVATATDDRTGEQMMEYAIKGLEPRPFARRVVGLCLWLRKAKLGWEASGVSGGFGKEVMEVLYYGNVFYRNVTQLGSQKKSTKPGWPCTDADKADMFEQFALAMENGSFVPRSEEMITECGEYEWDGAKIIHAPSKNKGATDVNHADRAISAAGTWLVFNTDNSGVKIDTSEETGQTPQYGSMAWRDQLVKKQNKSGSPRYGIRDVINRY